MTFLGLSSLVQFSPVVSHSKDRPVEKPPVEVPALAGIRWGKPADWAGLSAKDSPDGGDPSTTVINPPIYRQSTKVHDLTPVFRWYDVVKVFSRGEDGEPGEDFIEVEKTTALLIPLGQISERRMDAGGGTTVKVARFLKLRIDMDPGNVYAYVRSETEGDYPTYPVDVYRG